MNFVSLQQLKPVMRSSLSLFALRDMNGDRGKENCSGVRW